MPWSGGSFSRSNGTYTGADVWQDDADNAFDIEADRHDLHDKDLADGINATLNRYGQNAFAADIPAGGYNLTGLGAPSGDNDSARKKYVDDLVSDPTVLSFTETVYSLSGTTPGLDPANGTLQIWVLSANSTPTDSLASGQSITLHVLDGTAYTITWPTVGWIGGVAPTLDPSGVNVIQLWKTGSSLYGALVGVAS